MIPFSGPWYEGLWTALVLVNVALIVFAYRELSAAERLDAWAKVALGLAAIFLPFVGPVLAVLIARAHGSTRRTGPA